MVLGDDGVRYAFTPLGWRDAAVQPVVGMRVDFEVRGQHAVGVYPISDPLPPTPTPSAPTQPASQVQPPAQAPTPVATSGPDVLPTQVAPGMRPPQQSGFPVQSAAPPPVPMAPDPFTAGPSAPVPAERGFFSDTRRVVFAVIGVAAVIGIAIGAFFLAVNIATPDDSDVSPSDTTTGGEIVRIAATEAPADPVSGEASGSDVSAGDTVVHIEATEVPAQPISSEPDTGDVPFNLDWEISDGSIKRGESFTLAVRMHGLQQGGGHGGISVSFPSLTGGRASANAYSSLIADVTVTSYTSGLSKVAFHQPGAQIWDSNDEKISVQYLMVESDDSTWARSDDRTLLLRITPKRDGEFPIQIRGWLCDDEYANCLRNPTNDGAIDQQDYLNKVAKVQVGEIDQLDDDTPANVSSSDADDSDVARVSATAVPTGPVSSAPDTGDVPFKLDWEISDASVDRGESFTLSVRMHGLNLSGGHGGITVSFPSLIGGSASADGYSSLVADVAVPSYTTGLGNVTLHAPRRAEVWDSNDEVISVRYLLVESDDPTWARSDDRTLLLQITPKRAGDFPIQIRGWLCDDEYANCLRNPKGDGALDQQGYLNKVAKVHVTGSGRQDNGTTSNAGRIAFVSSRGGDLYTTNLDIYVMNADGSGIVQLTENSKRNDDPSWDPDGRRIAFNSDRDGDREIYVMNADGSGVVQLTENSARDAYPSWSPDGKRIAFASDRDGDLEVYVMNADGGGVVQLTENSAADALPRWSPDGRRIAFISDRDGDFEIYVMNADGGGFVQLTENSARDTYPSWTPDGHRIAYHSDRDGEDEVYVINADGSGIVQLTENSAADAFPSWSPDGRLIAFLSLRGGGYSGDIYVMNADGSGVMQLTDNAADDTKPSWSP